jgi:hypothetical protein
VFEQFKIEIAPWTNGVLNLNATYDLTPTIDNGIGAELSDVPLHSGSHPWLNAAFSAALTNSGVISSARTSR